MADLNVAIAIAAKDMASGPIGAVDKALGGLGKAGTMVAAGLAVGIGAIAALGVEGVKLAADLQQSVANISTIKPDIDTSAVFASLNEMSTRVPQSSKELGDALYNVFSSVDVSQAQALGLVETFAKGAVGAQTDAATFGTSILGVMNAYGMAAEDAGHISDVFFNTVNAGVVTGQELASSLGPVTESAKAAGVSLDELGGLIAGVTKEGGPAAQNINNLNNFLQKVTTTDAQNAMHLLGVATATATGEFRPTTDVLTDLKEKLGGMTEAGRANALQAIFPDAQARIGAQTLISQLDFVKGAIDNNIEGSGAASAAYLKMSETFASQSALLANTFSSILTTVGAELLPILTPLISAFAKELPAAFAQGKVAFAGVQDAVRPFVDAFMTALPAIQSFASEALAVIREFADGLRLLFSGDVRGAIDVFLDVVRNTGDLLGPILGEWARAFVDWIGPLIPPMLAELGALLQDLGDWLMSTALPAIAAQLEEWGAAFVSWVGPQIPPLLSALGGLLSDFGAWVTGTALPEITSAVQGWGQAFVDWLPSAIAGLIGGLADMTAQFLGWVTDTANGVGSGTSSSWVDALIAWIPGALGALTIGLGTLTLAFLQWIADTAPKVLAGMVTVGAAIIAGTDRVAPLALNAAMAVGGAIVRGLVAGIQAGIGMVTSAATNLATSALNAARSALGVSSPSREFEILGENLGEGLDLGLLGSIPKTKVAAKTYGDSILNEMQSLTSDVESLVTATTTKLGEIAIKAGDAITAALDKENDAIQTATERAASSIRSLNASFDLGEQISGRRSALSTIITEESRAHAQLAAAAEAEYQHKLQLSEAERKMHADLADAKTSKDRESIEQRYTATVADINQRYADSKVAVAHRHAIEEAERIFKAAQEERTNELNDKLAKEALARQIDGLNTARDASIATSQQTYLDAVAKTELTESTSRRILLASFGQRIADLKSGLIDKLPPLSDEAQAVIDGFLGNVDAAVASTTSQIISQTSSAVTSVSALTSAIEDIPDRTVTISTNYISSGSLAASGTAGASPGAQTGSRSGGGESTGGPRPVAGTGSGDTSQQGLADQSNRADLRTQGYSVGQNSDGSYYAEKRAAGGPVVAGGLYLVGENGPEYFTPGAGGGMISPNAGGATITINLNGTYLGDDRTLLRNLARELKPELDRLIEMRAV